MSAATVAGLAVYPIKSCRGIATAGAGVRTRGLVLGAGAGEVGDREWMIVDAQGRFWYMGSHNGRLGVIE